MNWKLATRAQLFQIIMDEPCDMGLKMEAAKELHRRKKQVFNRIDNRQKVKYGSSAKRFEILKRLNALEDVCQACPTKPHSDRHLSSPTCQTCYVLIDMQQIGRELDELIKRPEVVKEPVKRSRKGRGRIKPSWTKGEEKLLASLHGSALDVYSQFAGVYPERTKNAVMRKKYELTKRWLSK